MHTQAALPPSVPVEGRRGGATRVWPGVQGQPGTPGWSAPEAAVNDAQGTGAGEGAGTAISHLDRHPTAAPRSQTRAGALGQLPEESWCGGPGPRIPRTHQMTEQSIPLSTVPAFTVFQKLLCGLSVDLQILPERRVSCPPAFPRRIGAQRVSQLVQDHVAGGRLGGASGVAPTQAPAAS